MADPHYLYVDVTVLRIQGYLERWPRLSARRGASSMIAAATGQDAAAAYLGKWGVSEAEVNEEAGDAAGKVSFRLAGHQRAEELARFVLGQLRQELPAAELEAVWGKGVFYAEAVTEQIGAKRDSGDTVRWVPSPCEWSFSKICEGCGAATAVEAIHRPGSDEKGAFVCLDCYKRHNAGFERSVERQVTRAISERLGRELTTAPDLSSLARVKVDRSGKSNHLATIFLDGNRMGALFEEAARRPDDLKRRLSASVDHATREAVFAAAARVVDDDMATMPVLVHIAAGDDIVVQIPAALGWPFVTTVQRRFTEVLAEELGEFSDVSLSAGMVFAHNSYPFSECVRLAEGHLKRAKRFNAGVAAAISWTDCTRYDPNDEPLPVLTLDGIDSNGKALDIMSSWDRSRQRALEAAAKEGPDVLKVELQRFGLMHETGLPPAHEQSSWLGLLDIVRWWERP